MAFLKSFGAYVPTRVVGNEEMAQRVGATADWIRNVSGIEERRFAAADESLEDMAVAAARDCLGNGTSIGLVIVASGSVARRFPGPASAVAERLGLAGVPSIDLPMASAGSLFGLSLATRLAPTHGDVLVVGAEKMSDVILREPMERGVAVLFGDGAGACVVTPQQGPARVLDSLIASDGSFAADLRLAWDGPLEMNGRSVILQASRKMPAAIAGVLSRNAKSPADVEVFLVHQANQNLIDRIAQALSVDASKFYSNIRRYGNTSSASMLIAAAEWWKEGGLRPGALACFAAFGAGFHWGALLAEGV